jgi:hypothetical protein
MLDRLAIKQTSDVKEYHSRFLDAMDRVMIHHQGHDQVLFVQKFIDGLKNEIRHAILLHKPRIVDAAMSLAILQEEVLEASSMRYLSKPNKEYYKYQTRSNNRNSTTDKSVLGSTPAAEAKKDSKADQSHKFRDRLSNLKAVRRAQGECYKCGAKWGPYHKCPHNVPMHVMEAVLDVLHMNDDSKQSSDEDQSDTETELLSLSFCAVAGTTGWKTMRIHGLCGKQELLILIDLVSSASFLSEALVSRAQIQTIEAPSIRVFVANGEKLHSNRAVPHFTWLTQGHTFVTYVRVLPLTCYDMVLGMDWLETYSPMWVH